MAEVTCPLCEGEFQIDDDELVASARFYCEDCGALLEVTEESPLRLVVIDEDEDFDLDDEDDDDDLS